MRSRKLKGIPRNSIFYEMLHLMEPEPAFVRVMETKPHVLNILKAGPFESIPNQNPNSNSNTVEIVLHVLRSGETENGTVCSYGLLYRVNLETGRVSKCPVGKLFMDDSLTSMVVSGNVICILGGARYSRYKSKGVILGTSSHVHSGASFVDFGVDAGDDDEAKSEWKPLPNFASDEIMYACASMDGHIFVFGGRLKYCIDKNYYSPGEVLSLLSKQGWRFLPEPPDTDPDTQPDHGKHVSSPPLVDADNNRIIVHIRTKLYAYYPYELRWECIDSTFGAWHELVALFDGIILFHSRGGFYVYHLQSKNSITPTISTNFPRSLLFSEFDGLIPLAPPGNFCLATYSPELSVPDKTHLFFIKFRVEHTHSGELLITFMSRHKLHLDCSATVTNYVPIQVKNEDARNPPQKDDFCAAPKHGLGICVGSFPI